MKKAMRKGLVSLVTGAAMVASPMAFAAQDTAGMHYVSASEGFYASIRARYNSGGGKDDGADIQNSSSRIGITGTNDLGGGLSGFYTYELGVGIDDGNNDDLKTRLGNVGLRGGFGEFVAGTFWDQTYNWTHGSTDVANVGSANVLGDLPVRSSKSVQYTTPDLNGFQAALRFTMDKERDGLGELGAATPAVPEVNHIEYGVFNVYEVVRYNDPETGDPTPDTAGATTMTIQILQFEEELEANHLAGEADTQSVTPDEGQEVCRTCVNLGAIPEAATVTLANEIHEVKFVRDEVSAVTVVDSAEVPADPGNKDDNDLDSWALSAKYSVQGFDVAAAYLVEPDGIKNGTDDLSAYVFRVGYSQDNWYVNGWYSEDNAQDDPENMQDREKLSFAGGVSVDQVSIYGLYETIDDEMKREDSYATVGVQYNLGSNSHVWLEYASQDKDSDPNAEDYVTIGMQHNF